MAAETIRGGPEGPPRDRTASVLSALLRALLDRVDGLRAGDRTVERRRVVGLVAELPATGRARACSRCSGIRFLPFFTNCFGIVDLKRMTAAMTPGAGDCRLRGTENDSL